MMKYVYIMLVLILAAVRGGAQTQADRVVVRVADQQSGKPLAGAQVIDAKGVLVAQADSGGYVVVPLDAMQGRVLVALHYGYKPDTLQGAVSRILMQPLTMQLPEAVVTNAKITNVLQAGNEYVVDYEPAGSDIIVATYSGNGGGRAKLFLLNKDHAAVDTCRLPDEPVAVYRSCVGRYYCVCAHEFYPLQLWGGKVTLQPPYNISMLAGLQECQAAARGNHYYRLGDKQNFAVEYGVILRDDSVFKHIAGFEQRKVAMASMEELMEIIALLEMGNFNKAAKMQLRRKMYDRASYAHMDMPLYAVHDTLVVFDYVNKQLLLCNLAGDSLATVPIQWRWRDSQHFKVLQDAGTGRLYLHRYEDMTEQTLEELSISKGSCGAARPIARPFAEQVKVYNGEVYFLWQDRAARATRQLYVQE